MVPHASTGKPRGGAANGGRLVAEQRLDASEGGVSRGRFLFEVTAERSVKESGNETARALPDLLAQGTGELEYSVHDGRRKVVQRALEDGFALGRHPLVVVRHE